MQSSKALLLAVALGLSAHAATGQTKPVRRPATLGTAQLPGDNGKIGQAYTMGKESRLNFVLTGVRYAKTRWSHGSDTTAPTVGQKLLILDYQVQNPNREVTSFSEGALTFTAIDGEGANHEGVPGVVGKGRAAELSIALKPAQRIDAESVVVVPAKGPIPKLMVAHRSGGGVLRYDLHGLVGPLPKPLSENGVDALPRVAGKAGVAYPLLMTDLTYVSTAFKAGAFADLSEQEGKVYMLAKIALVVRTPGNQAFQIHGEAIDEDGERYPSINLHKASTDGEIGGIGEPGQEVACRMLLAVPKGVKIAKLRVWEGDNEYASSAIELPLGLYATEDGQPLKKGA